MRDAAFSWRPGKLLCEFKNVTDFPRFCCLNIPCLRIEITLIFTSSESDVFMPLKENSKIDVSVGFRPPYWCPSKKHQYGVSIQSFVNLGKTFPEYLGCEIRHKPDFWRGFLCIYLLSFLTFWTFCIEWFKLFLFSMTWRWKQRTVDLWDVTKLPWNEEWVREIGKWNMGTKQRIGNEVTDRAGVQVRLFPIFHFPFTFPRSPFLVPPWHPLCVVT